jgi:hypothetical protein
LIAARSLCSRISATTARIDIDKRI